jgi:hypothetical protein
VRVLSYVYPGWHPIAERDASFYPGFTEWDLVYQCRPRFEGHAQPRLPLWGRYDDRDPGAIERRIALCREHGVDGWVYGFFWCRGKRVFQEALDLGFLGAPSGAQFPFALMWANRMPRRVLPVTRAELDVIEPERRVSSDVADFVRFVGYVAERYFARPNYVRVEGKPYLSIFDSTFFVRELGVTGARRALRAAREELARRGFPGLHLAAIDPQPEIIARLADIGFDSTTHYVLLPAWKGPPLQDYAERARLSAESWHGFSERSGLPHHPSVSPGWDASPRGADFGPARPDKYPWSPVVTGEHPDLFREAVRRAARFATGQGTSDPLVFIASLNEWSEGHSIEPDERHGMAWLEAVRDGRTHRVQESSFFRY